MKSESATSTAEAPRLAVAPRRILCPVDLSTHSKTALGYAVELSRWYQAELAVLHVAAPAPPISSLGESTATSLEPASRAALHEDVLRELRRFTSSVVSGETLKTELREGPVVEEILAAAAQADLLVLGAQGLGRLERWLLGSVADKVVREAACPILVVPPAVAGPPPSPSGMLRRILCAVAFDAPTALALSYAESLASRVDGRVLPVHVVRETGALTAETESAARRRLTDLTAVAPQRFEPVRLSAGRPHEEIVRLAGEWPAELIVMGTRAGVRGRGLGSTTDRVFRSAPCPVLAVPVG